MTAASESAEPPARFEEPSAPAPPSTPGNGHGLVLPTRRHRFVADEAGASDALEEAEITTPHERPHALTKKETRQLGALRARKVRRTVRHIEPWSVLKLSLLFYFCLFVIVMVAGTILWNLASAAGTIGSVESFFKQIGFFESFTFQGGTIFRACLLGGLILVIAGSALNVLLTVLFNLISDVVGGIRVTVLEEDTARPIASGDKGPRR